jgi:hypothetical protein
MTVTDTLTRITQIQAQLVSLTTAFTPGTAVPASASTAAIDPTAATASASSAVSAGSATSSGASFASQLQAAQTAQSTSTSGVTLSAAASSRLTSAQRQFASRLAADTGLDSNVVAAWLLAEESGGAAQSRQAAKNNDWLNIGYTDSATYGASDSIWSDPTTAADATAGWLKGQNTIPGYGTASGGIRSILNTAGQSPAAQITALQRSGWASSGYPSLPALYQELAG